MTRHPSLAIRVLLADNVSRLRRARGWTQAQLARVCGLTPSTLGEIEQARINLTLAALKTLATGLECRPADLLIPVHVPTPPEGPRAPGLNST